MKMLTGLVLFTATFAVAPVTRVPAQEAAFQLNASATIPDILRDRIGTRTTLRM